MKNKLLLSVFVLVSVLVGARGAFASSAYIYPTGNNTGEFNFYVPTGDHIYFFDADGTYRSNYYTAEGFTPKDFTQFGDSTMKYLLTTATPCNGGLDYATCLLVEPTSNIEYGNIDINTGIVTNLTPPPTQPTVGTAGLHGISILGGTSSGTSGTSSGTLQASDFTAQTANALQATGAGMFPIVAVVAGLILAFAVSRYLIGTFKQAGTTKGDTKQGYWADSKGNKIRDFDPKGELHQIKKGVWVRE